MTKWRDLGASHASMHSATQPIELCLSVRGQHLIIASHSLSLVILRFSLTYLALSLLHFSPFLQDPVREGTNGCPATRDGNGSGWVRVEQNPPIIAPTTFTYTHPLPHPWVKFHTRTHTRWVSGTH
jgi:hypothetical protein